MSARAQSTVRSVRSVRPVRGWRSGGLPALIAFTVALGGAAVTAPSAAAEEDCSAIAVTCFPRMAMGMSTPGLPASTASLSAFESALGRPADVALTFTSFRFAFDPASLRTLALAGRTPMITWEPFDATVPTENRYPLRDIAAGANDVYLRAQAARISGVGKPVALRFGHEMNAAWYPWGAGVNGNTPADYVAAYRHIHDLFAQEGVHNVTWVWSPAALDTTYAPDLAQFYPGDDYVDWAGLSAYYDQPTDTWTNTVAPTVRQLDRVAPDAPIYLAETGVLPGPTRPAMIRELLGSLLRTPRAVGFTWFNAPSREDWRIDSDPAALAAVSAELGSGWYGAAASVAALPPLVQVAPLVSGIPQVGSTLTSTAGAWRGAASTSGRWLLCADASAGSCVAADATSSTITLGDDALGRTARYEVTATSPGGATTVSSEPSAPVLIVPAQPARPLVEARSGGARVTFPAAPLGTTHWRLRVDGAPLELVPVGSADYWLTGLVNGTSHSLSLAAAAVSSAATFESPTTAGTFTPMTQQYNPYVSVTGPVATFTLPKAPAGAQKWVLTVNGAAQHLPITATTASVPGLATGQPLQWSLQAGAGLWDGAAYGCMSVPSTGAFTPLATPATPVIVPGPGTITLMMPPVPSDATAWRVSVGSKTYPDLAAGSASLTATGLYPGYPSTWTLRAVNITSRSLVVTGTGAAR